MVVLQTWQVPVVQGKIVEVVPSAVTIAQPHGMAWRSTNVLALVLAMIAARIIPKAKRIVATK